MALAFINSASTSANSTSYNFGNFTAGTWQDAAADNTGTAAHFRIYDSTGTICHGQGTVTAIGGGGDMEVQNVSFAAGQTITITSFTLTAGNP